MNINTQIQLAKNQAKIIHYLPKSIQKLVLQKRTNVCKMDFKKQVMYFNFHYNYSINQSVPETHNS